MSPISEAGSSRCLTQGPRSAQPHGIVQASGPQISPGEWSCAPEVQPIQPKRVKPANLAAASSLFDTGFYSTADLRERTRTRATSGTDLASRGDTKEFAPSYSKGSGHHPLFELQPERRFKQVSFRPSGEHPASTGTSKLNYPCLTNGLVPCVAVMMTGASPDGTRRKARLFHVASSNTKAGDALVEYKNYLATDGLTEQFAVLAGGEVRPEKYKELGMDDAAAKAAASQTRDELATLKAQLSAGSIRVAKDDTGENRPDYLTGMSNVGFELKERDRQIKFSYLKNVSLD